MTQSSGVSWSASTETFLPFTSSSIMGYSIAHCVIDEIEPVDGI
jgi:hypothetical protein